ncbi:MAG: hypothetical protein V7K69_04700 [Nostoc sp.]
MRYAVANTSYVYFQKSNRIPIVLCELVWVLWSNTYQFSREEISNTIELMVKCSVFELENRSVSLSSITKI